MNKVTLSFGDQATAKLLVFAANLSQIFVAYLISIISQMCPAVKNIFISVPG